MKKPGTIFKFLVWDCILRREVANALGFCRSKFHDPSSCRFYKQGEIFNLVVESATEKSKLHNGMFFGESQQTVSG